MDRLFELYDEGVNAPKCETVKAGKHNGFEYFILWYRNHPNAYIKIPKGHPFYEKDHNEIDDKGYVHGCFTFSDKNLNKDHGLEDGWYLGWDYAHAGDYQAFSDGFIIPERRWSVQEIEDECKLVIDVVIRGKNESRSSD